MKRRISILLCLICILTPVLTGCEVQDKFKGYFAPLLEELEEESTPQTNEQTDDSLLVREPKESENEELPESSTDYSITEFDVEEDTQGFPQEEADKRANLGLSDEGINEIISKQAGLYAFEFLTSNERVLYAEILCILENRVEEIVVTSVDEVEIDKVFQCVMNDHPEIFYVSGYTYTKYTLGALVQRISFSGSYSMEVAQIEEARIQIEQYAQNCLSGIDQSMGEYEKIKYIYEYVIENTQYDLTAPENQNLISVCIYKKSVCQGYAKTMQYLLNKAGVMATLVIGKVNTGEGHAWNLIRVDGEYYYVDATWGDAFYRFGETDYESSQQRLPLINYDYLCVTSDAINRTHTVENIVAMPLCTSLAANYYMREGTYFVAFDENLIAEAFADAYQKGETYLTLKAASDEIYTAIQQNLIQDQKIFNYLSQETKTIAYTMNDEQRTISFWL